MIFRIRNYQIRTSRQILRQNTGLTFLQAQNLKIFIFSASKAFKGP